MLNYVMTWSLSGVRRQLSTCHYVQSHEKKKDFQSSLKSFPTVINMLLRSLRLTRHCLRTVNFSMWWSRVVVVENEDCKELTLLNFPWNDDKHNLMHGCRVKWNLQLLLQKTKSSWHCPSSMDILSHLWSMLGITYLLRASSCTLQV